MRYPRSSLVVLGLFVGCGGLEETDDPPDDRHVLGTYDPLRRVADCEELAAALKEDARERLRRSLVGRGDNHPDPDTGSDGSGGETDGGGGGASGGTGGTGTGGGGGRGSDEHSSTNTQVDGVDEADFIKTDGEWIYVVRDGQLYVSQGWPADELRLASQAPIEGRPFDMFLVEQDPDAGLSGPRTVVVYSMVDGTEVYDAAGVEPPNSGGVGGFAGGIEDGSTGTKDPSGVGGGPGTAGNGSDPFSFGQPPSGYWFPNQLVKLTVLKGEADDLKLEDSVYLEGNYVSSRRNGEVVRTALQLNPPDLGLKTYPTENDRQKAAIVLVARLLAEGRDVESIPSDELARLVGEVLAEMLIEENEEIIDGLDYEKWLPHVFRRVKGDMKATAVACEDFYLPPPAAGDGGLTHVAQVNLDDLELSTLGVLGRTDTLYENASSFVLAASGSEIVDGAWSDKPVTYLHWFGISKSSELEYRASGTIPGFVDGQFAIDEADGALRVASTTGGWIDEPESFVSVLKPTEQSLEVVGQVGPLARGEQIYSVRYVGDTAYVVTFRQVDPLFVVDLADPEKPKLLGELKIPGFSEYMHPLGKDHLFTVGRDGDETGTVGNVALQIFDVSDPVDPVLAHKFVFDKWGDSEGLVTHKAVTYFAEQKLLALPFSSANWSMEAESSLELFHVDTEGGFEYRGAMSGLLLRSPAELPGSGYYCDSWALQAATQFRRGVFIDDILYGVAYKGIVAATVEAPETPVNTLRFDENDVVPTYCYSDGSGGTGGSGGMDGGTGGVGGGTGGVGGGPDTGGTGGVGGDPGTGGSAGTGGVGGGPDTGGVGGGPGTGGSGAIGGTGGDPTTGGTGGGPGTGGSGGGPGTGGAGAVSNG